MEVMLHCYTVLFRKMRNNGNGGLDRCLSSERHWLFLQKTQVQVPASTWQAHNHLWLRFQGIQSPLRSLHTCGAHKVMQAHAHKIAVNKSFYFLIMRKCVGMVGSGSLSPINFLPLVVRLSGCEHGGLSDEQLCCFDRLTCHTALVLSLHPNFPSDQPLQSTLTRFRQCTDVLPAVWPAGSRWHWGCAFLYFILYFILFVLELSLYP